MSSHIVSVIVPVYNAQKTIEKCVESLCTLQYDNLEIIIIDDGSTDKTRQFLAQHRERINLIEAEHIGPSKCRNLAAKKARGAFLAFTDSDCIVDKEWIDELLKGFDNEDVVAVGGSQHSPADETIFGKKVQLFFESTGFLGGYIKKNNVSKIIEVEHNPSCNVMYKKNIFLKIGGFDEGLWPSEDVDLDYRLKRKGHCFKYNSLAKVYHYRPQTLKSLCSMMYRYGTMQGILTKRYGMFRPIQFVPIVFIIFVTLIIFRPLLAVFLVFALGCAVAIRAKNLKEAGGIIFLSAISSLLWIRGFLKGLIISKK